MESVEIDKIKEQERIKIIVKENLEKYLSEVQSFKDSLKDLEKDSKNPGRLINEIDRLIGDFQKRSSMSFQKATILIGKELGAIRDCIKKFLANTRKVISENKDSLDKIKTIEIIEEGLSEKNNLENLRLNLLKKILEQDKEIKEIEKEIKKIGEDIEITKKSRGYIDEITKKKDLENLKEELNNAIFNLKKLIDFKSLASFFHINEKDMKLIKVYKENFKEVFERDDGITLERLLKESKLLNETIKEKINNILEKKRKIANSKDIPKKNVIEEMKKEITSKQNKIEDLNIEKIKEKKRDEKIKENIKNTLESIKRNLAKINVEIITNV